MPTEIGGTRKPLIRAQAVWKRSAVAMFGVVADSARGVLLAYADGDGVIPLRSESSVLARIGAIVDGMFVAHDGRSAFDPDTNAGLSPFARALNLQIANVTYGVFAAHSRWLEKVMPDDVKELWRSVSLVAETDPEEMRRKLEQAYEDLQMFSPNPLAQYESAHTWVDPRGYRLSDRIWQVSVRTRTKIDALVSDGIRSGMSAFDLAQQLERFLIPGRAAIRTEKPYGDDASYDAMRLARTEITRAHGQAAMLAARRNPYVDEMDWRLSSSHPKPDICDDNAAASPYLVDDIPQYPAHPHCLCVLTPIVNRKRSVVTQEIRTGLLEARQANLPANITPLQLEQLTRQILGDSLMRLLQGAIG